jgi:hypothetical protein
VTCLPPSVHDWVKQGLVSFLIPLARKKGISAIVGEGLNRWPAVHRLDAARLFRLALEKGSAGARYHGVAEEGVPFRHIAEVIGRHLKVPVAATSAGHFGFLAPFVSIDNPTSSRFTEERLGWRPTQLGLIADLDHAGSFEARTECVPVAQRAPQVRRCQEEPTSSLPAHTVLLPNHRLSGNYPVVREKSGYWQFTPQRVGVSATPSSTPKEPAQSLGLFPSCRRSGRSMTSSHP